MLDEQLQTLEQALATFLCTSVERLPEMGGIGGHFTIGIVRFD